MTIVLGEQQNAAMRSIAHWWRTPSKRAFYRLDGWAGTGKTELAMRIEKGVSGRVVFTALTGKAVDVLRGRGCSNAATLHSLIYTPRGDSSDEGAAVEQQRLEREHMWKPTPENKRKLQEFMDGAAERAKNAGPKFSLNPDSEIHGASLIIVDEHSFIGETEGNDLLRFGIPVLAMGDPGQLPPVSGPGFFSQYEPDFTLTEIHRQAQDNPVLWAATRVRMGEGMPPPGDYGQLVIKSTVTDEELLAADQVIVGRNNTRRRMIRRIRQLRGNGTDPLPKLGERLICLRNDKRMGLFNGGQWLVRGAEAQGRFTMLDLRSMDNGYDIRVRAWTDILTGEPERMSYTDRRAAAEFDFADALTLHKFQGSQASNIVLVNESTAFNGEGEGWRWEYTGLTRTTDRMLVVRG
jgi:exodeoxyribonuclease-5